MSSLIQTERGRLGLAVISTAAVTLSLVTAYNSFSRRHKRKDLKREVEDAVSRSMELGTGHTSFSLPDPADLKPSTSGNVFMPKGTTFDEGLIREQLARNYTFFGEEAMKKVRGARVVVVGCGGVGSWAATMLIRSGVSYVRLVDFDMVTLSSLNRHAVATLADVGTPKVEACKKFFKGVAPWVEVDARMQLWKSGLEGEELLGGDIDWVVDAIDNITTKVELLKYCHSRGIKVFASMGAGAKSDPTRVQISDIASTLEDPLARSVRRRLRLDGITSGIPVVYSTEVPGDVKLLPLPEEEFKKGAVHELSALDDFRVRILPVLGPLPSIFGLHIATYILCDLAGKPIPNPMAAKNRVRLYEKLMRDLTARDARITSAPGFQKKLPIDETDIGYIFEDLHRGRSTLPPHEVLAKPVLCRWDVREPLSVLNCVILDPENAKRLEEGGGIGRDVFGEEVAAIVEKRKEEALHVQRWRW